MVDASAWTPANDPSPAVVVIGAASGGLAPLRSVLRSIPQSARISVLVLSPRAPMHATDLDGHALSSVAAEDGARLEPGFVYLVPHDRDLEIREGKIALRELVDDIAPIDRAFRSVSSACGASCACVVLSGVGADGALGLKRVKEAGGLTIAQDPDEAAFETMPKSAIATGLVDLVLTASAIGPRIASVADPVMPFASQEEESDERAIDPLRELLSLVRIRSGHDFSNYKRPTLLRRVARRMLVSQSAGLPAYLRHVREDPNELPGLLRDFMISVTTFFRDPEVFGALDRSVLTRALSRAEPSSPVRIWVAGCATGEEAYSLAMLCADHAQRMAHPNAVQIFATDIDQGALAIARAGIYPPTIRADVPAEMLARYFTLEPDGSYRVKKEIRERVLFSPHNVLRDPPFSRLDLVTCRNLFIYLNREAQDRVLAIVHFGLKPDGHLLLGSSETAETASLLFHPFDAKHRIFARRAFSPPLTFAASFPHATWHPLPSPTPPSGSDRRTSFGELHQRLVEEHAAPSVLVNDDLDVVHLSARAGRYFSLVGGEPTRNLLRLIHDGLRLDIRAVIYAARERPGTVHKRTVPLTMDGEPTHVTVTARGIERPSPARRMLLVTFEERPASDEAPTPVSDPAVTGAIEPVVRQLEDELARTREQLRSTIEQYEISVEELKASNEELHAINAELRAAGEELETGKEELQSVNEELSAVNAELKQKIDELSRANGDLTNLMASTQIAVMFLDRALRIQRYTPRALDLFNVIPTDVGRPLAHITHRLEGIDLVEDATAVLGDLRTVEREARSKEGAHYLARLHPYRSIDDRIDGVVVTLLHVTELKHAEEALRGQDRRLRLAQRAAVAGFWECDRSTHRFRMTDEYQQLVGLQIEGSQIGCEEWLATLVEDDRGRARQAMERAFKGDELNLHVRVLDRAGNVRWLWHTGRLESDGDATRGSVSGIAIDVTTRRSTEAALLESEWRFRSALKTAPVVILTQDREQKYTWGYGGGAELEVNGKTDRELFPEEEAVAFERLKAEVLTRGTGASAELQLTFRGARRTYEMTVEPLRDEGSIVGLTCTAVDVTASRDAERALRDADRKKDEFLATLAHELRNPLAPIRAALDIQKLAGTDSDLIARTRDKMDRQLGQIVRLVDDLMDVGRIASGRIRLRLEVFPLVTAIDAAIESTRPLFQSLGHTLLTKVRNKDVLLHADFTRVTQVLTNLLGNAAKYTRAGGHVELEVRAFAQAGHVEIRVTDDGVGIDAEMLPHVFDMFSQSPATLDRAHGGLGIGLSLVKRLVELHGGKVLARSEGKGRGAEFVVTLPWTGRVRAPAAGSDPAAFEPKHVLVVDDNPDVTDMLAEVLRLVGHEATRAHDGATAVSLADEQSPDIVILDIGLPDMDGYETGRRIRATPRGAEIVLIAMTGWEGAVSGDDERVFDHYLTKPADLAELQRLVQTARPKRNSVPPPPMG